jgi:hypothetical protein
MLAHSRWWEFGWRGEQGIKFLQEFIHEVSRCRQQ